MSFLNPFMLFGAGAIAVPIIIHLLNRRRFQRVVWAAMRFVKVSTEKNQRRMLVEDMILLAIRCLMLALLALAVARPAMRSTTHNVFGQSKVTAVIVLDNSASMGVSDGVQMRFDKARKIAEQAVDALPSGSAAAVILASDVAKEVIKEPTHDLNLARKTVREAPLSDRATDLFPSIEKALETLKGRSAIRKEIYVVTDGQLAGWRQLGDIQKTLKTAKEQTGEQQVSAHLVLVGDAQERNLGVSGLVLSSGLAPLNRPLRFEAQVANYGKQESKDIKVSLLVDGASADEVTIPSIPPGGTRSVPLNTRFKTEGWHNVTVRIAADRFPGDDTRTLAVRAIREIRVLIVDGEPGTEPRESETFFLGHALVPVSAEETEQYYVKTSTIAPGDMTGTRFDDFDAVVLANVPDFSPDTASAMENFVKRGGGLLIFPGAKVNAAFYNSQLGTARKLLPATFGEPHGDAAQEEKFLTFQTKGYDHPIVALWNDANAGTLASTRTFRSFELNLLPAATGETEKSSVPTPTPAPAQTNAPVSFAAPKAVLRYSDGSIAMAERALGLGRVVMFASTADTAWNDLAVRPAFVPLLHRTLGTLIQRHDDGANVRVGAQFARRLTADLLHKDAVVMAPGAASGTRELRRVELVNGTPVLSYEATDKAGIYEVSIADPATVIKFAAQPDPSESSLSELPAEEVTALGQVVAVQRWHPTLNLREWVEKARVGAEFWLPILMLVLALAALETFLAQYFSRAK
ncbi:MAG: BatA domain-containing protein [Verrucomicrobia bacterium]|nr:BatA domain-containing protein [Verrucomicrobiota bacterium]